MTSYRLWPATDGPGTEDNSDPVTLGTRFKVTSTGWVTHLHYWRSTTNDNGTHTGAVYEVSGGTQVSGTLVTFTDSGTGWQTAQLSSPVQLTANTLYCVAVLHPNGHPPFTGSYWTSGGPGASGITNGILNAPNSSDAGGQGVFASGSSLQHPTGSFNQTNYWTDVTVTDTDPTVSATADASATGTATAAGTRTAVASAGATASGTAAASGARTAVAAADASATGTAGAAGTRTATGVADASAQASAAATGDRTATGTAAASASGSASAAGFRGLFGSAAASATGTASVADDSLPTAAASAMGTALATLHPVIRRPRRGTIHRP